MKKSNGTGSCPRLESKSISLESEHDIIIARSEVRTLAAALGFRPIDQTRLATVTSELARNVIKYGMGGRLIAEPTEAAQGVGLRLIFEDEGPGIPNLEAAMRDGFSTGKGLGKGLPGSKRLVHEFEIESMAGQGTRVTIVRWRT